MRMQINHFDTEDKNNNELDISILSIDWVTVVFSIYIIWIYWFHIPPFLELDLYGLDIKKG